MEKLEFFNPNHNNDENMLTIMNHDEIIGFIERVNDYWITNYEVGSAFWERGAYNTGNIEAYMLTGIEAYRKYSERWAVHNQWMGHPNKGNKSTWTWGYSHDPEGTAVLFGDWQTCFQTYLDLYGFDAEPEPNKIARTLEVMEYQISKYEDDFWWWADGLYMVMPVMTKLYLVTQNEKYLDKLYQYFTYAIELMYDGEEGIPTSVDGYRSSAYNRGPYGGKSVFPSDFSNPADYRHLFYRDANYVYPANPLPGEYAKTKNFWARGNGWVFAALAKVLQDVPENWKHRDLFLTIYMNMAKAIRDCQKMDNNGRVFWTQSMLAHNYSCSNENPYGYETSGTAFFTYGITWGINSGILDRNQYLDTALRGWKYLTEVAIHDTGKVGYVQWVGAKAGTAAVHDNTQDFAVGATLLAGCEMAKLSGGMTGDFYPYLQKRMVSTVALKVHSPYLFANNKLSMIDAENADLCVIDRGGIKLVPANIFSDHLGFEVIGDSKTNGVRLISKCVSIHMQIGNTSYLVNEQKKTLVTAPEIINGIIYVPVCAIAEDLGRITYVNDNEGLIVIGHKSNMFSNCETGMVSMLSKMLYTGTIPERESHQDEI